jgi:hypothetical protein
MSKKNISLLMEAERVSETLGFCPELTRLVAREDFIEFSRRESFKHDISQSLRSLTRPVF